MYLRVGGWSLFPRMQKITSSLIYDSKLAKMKTLCEVRAFILPDIDTDKTMDHC